MSAGMSFFVNAVALPPNGNASAGHRLATEQLLPKGLGESVCSAIRGVLQESGIAVATAVTLQEGALVCVEVAVEDVDFPKFAEVRGTKKAQVAGYWAAHVSEDQVKRRIGLVMLKELPRQLPEALDATPLVWVGKASGDQAAWLAELLQAMQAGDVPWESDKGARLARAWDEEAVRREARATGLLRPWALLASMLLDQRAEVCQGLQFESVGGTGGAEAWDVLVRKGKGVGPRANGVRQAIANVGDPLRCMSGWTHVLLRLLEGLKAEVPRELAALDRPQKFTETRAEGNRPATEDGRPTPIGRLERLYLDLLQKAWLGSLEAEQRQAVEDMAQGYDGEALASAGLEGCEALVVLARSRDGSLALADKFTEKLKTMGVRVALTQALKLVSPALGLAMLGRNVTLAVCGSDPLGCEQAVTAILLQRVALAADGIDLDDILRRDQPPLTVEVRVEQGPDAARTQRVCCDEAWSDGACAVL